MKIKNKLLPKLKNLTKCEMDAFIYLVCRQEKDGHVWGVHNKALCNATGMKKQSFYNALRGLQEKEVIIYKKSSDIDYLVKIIDNDFSYPGANREGYVDLQRSVYHKKSFKELKAREKWLVFWFIHITNENTQTHQIGEKKFYKTYTEMLGVTKRVIRGYMRSIKKFFSIGLKDGLYYITYLHEVFKTRREIGQRRSATENFVEVQCRRLKIKNVPYKQIKDTAYLLVQYKDYAEIVGRNIERILIKAIAHAAFQFKRPKDRKLNSKYIHKIVRVELGLEEAVTF